MRIWLAGSSILLALLLSACETIGYYGQAVGGHIALLAQRQSIDTLLKDASLEPALQTKLAAINRILAFAQAELQLPAGKHYRHYVPLDRPFVVWNVFATPEFSLSPHTWCFPVAGCVSYRGYYSESAAQKFAEGLRGQGNDVYVGGVAAYSTLGWFADPLLSSVINREDWQLASLLFHELAHQVVYVQGDTEFNESFATTVEKAGLQNWLAATDGSDSSEVLEKARLGETRQADFVSLVQAAADDLRILYASNQTPEQMRTAKQVRLQRLRDDYARQVNQWGGYAGYHNWFDQDINNAQLSTVATYNSLVPAFTALLEREGSFPAFYKAAAELARLEPAARSRQLAQLQAY